MGCQRISQLSCMRGQGPAANLSKAFTHSWYKESWGRIDGFANVYERLLAVNNANYYEQAVPEGCFDAVIYPKVYKDSVRVDSEGYVHAPPKPGLGFEIALEEAKKVTVERLKP